MSTRILRTEYLWDNRDIVEENASRLGIPVNEDLVEEEWREVSINIALVAYFYPVSYISSRGSHLITEVVLNTASCKSFIINVGYEEFSELVSIIHVNQVINISKINLNEEQEQMDSGDPE